jgi:2-polyprenyl-3-methyl-5-hydroxy-6-metoxy-1,4-benzoquinol methylase
MNGDHIRTTNLANRRKEISMSSSSASIDEQIADEIKRIARDVIDWDKSEATETGYKPHWKPRFATDGLRVERKRIVPIDPQMYNDLQLSRGSTGNEKPDLNWEFTDPATGVGDRREINEERWNELLKYNPVNPDVRLLDLGTRNGQFLYFLNSLGFSNTKGIDCVKLNSLWCQKNDMDVIHGDVHDLTQHIEAESLDVVTAYHVFEHCYDPQKVINEMHKVLAPSGAVHIEIPIEKIDQEHAHCYAFSRRELGKMLKKGGFTLVHTTHQGRPWSGIERVVAKKNS